MLFVASRSFATRNRISYLSITVTAPLSSSLNTESAKSNMILESTLSRNGCGGTNGGGHSQQQCFVRYPAGGRINIGSSSRTGGSVGWHVPVCGTWRGAKWPEIASMSAVSDWCWTLSICTVTRRWSCKPHSGHCPISALTATSNARSVTTTPSVGALRSWTATRTTPRC